MTAYLDPTPAGATIALDPPHNVLNSMALLTRTAQMRALPAWLHTTAAQMTPAARDTNRMLFEELASTLAIETQAATFPDFLAALEDEPPAAMQERAAAGTELSAEARGLTADPQTLRTTVIEHLHGLWKAALEGEWRRAERDLQGQLYALQRGAQSPDDSDPRRTLRNLWTYLGAEAAGGAKDVRDIIYVPSPHTGRYVTSALVGRTLRVFFHAPRHYAALFRASPVEPVELQSRLAALNDETRLRVLGLFEERDQLTAQDVMESLGLSQSTTSRALNGLRMFLLSGRSGDTKKSYTLMPSQIDLTMRALKSVGQPHVAPDRLELPSGAAPGLLRFLDTRQRITMWPARQKDQLLVLDYLVSRFEPGQEYTEREVNAIINRHHAYGDPVTLRRELCDYGYLRRKPDGSSYRRAELPEAP